MFIGIAGPSGAGKTTVCERLKTSADQFEHIRLDDYLKDPKFFPRKHGFVNWDSVQNIRFEMLLTHLRMLAKGKSVRLYISRKIAGQSRVVLLRPKKYIVVEGFMALKRKGLRDLYDLSIFIDIPAELILTRRRKRYGSDYFEEYDKKIVIPEFLHSGMKQKSHSDYIVDGSRPSREVFNNVRAILKTEFM